MSATIAEGTDGEPGGLDPEETVMECNAKQSLRFATIDLAGRTAFLALSFKDGLVMAAYLMRQRRIAGH